MKQLTRVLAVTGTKGKTTCVRALHYAINAAHTEPVLGVDTHRIMLGSDVYMSKEEYTELFGLGTAVTPGKTLLALRGQAQPVAVLEASFSTWQRGLGYHSHEIGIFTNVFDDHIKPDEAISNREQLAAAKASYILKHIGVQGSAIYNADNDLIPECLGVIPADRNITTIACTLDSTRECAADYVATVQDEKIVIKDRNGSVAYTTEFMHMPWLHGGNHQPSLYNGMFVVSALWRFFKDDTTKFEAALAALGSYVPDADGGRMVVRTAANGAKVILDFAHEGESMKQIAQYARSLVPEHGSVVGVLRLNNARHDEHISNTAHHFLDAYDRVFIYDMAQNDGENGRVIGEVPAIIQRVANEHGVQADIINDDQAALAAARDSSTPDTVIVYIIRDYATSYQTANTIFNFQEEPSV